MILQIGDNFNTKPYLYHSASTTKNILIVTLKGVYIMKKITAFLLLTTMIFFSSCRDLSTDEQILNRATSDEHLFTIDRSSTLVEYYGNYSQEDIYSPTSTEDIEGIYSPRYQKINNDRYYFTVKKRYETDTQQTAREIYAYINTANGEKHYVCSDPLCTHTELEECKYLNLMGNIYFGEDDVFYMAFMDGLYSGKSDVHWVIYEFNLKDDSINIIYQCNKDRSQSSINILFLYNNNLYFHEIDNIESTDGSKEYDSVYTLKVLDLSTKKTSVLDSVSSKYIKGLTPLYMSQNICLFAAGGKIFQSDFYFNNEQEIFALSSNEILSSYFYDEKTQELYFNTWNTNDNYGSIYKYDGSTVNQVKLPHDNIYCFQLTNSKIYYSAYDPYYYGPGMRGGKVYDYTGGKIYSTDRNGSSESVLIFDDGIDFSMNSSFSYLILGDYLYFDYMALRQENGYVWYSMALELKKVRINLKEHTVKYLSFD